MTDQPTDPRSDRASDRIDAPSGTRAGRYLAAIPDGVSSLVLFVLMVMTCIDVIGRELLNDPLDGATELTQLMLGVIVFAVLIQDDLQRWEGVVLLVLLVGTMWWIMR